MGGKNEGGGGKTPSGNPGQKVVNVGKEGLSILKNMQKMLEEERSSYTVTQFEANLSGYASINEARLKSIEASIRSISSAGLTFAKGGKVNEAITTVATMMDKLAGNADLGAKAVTALAKSMELFPQLAETQENFAEKIALQAASLDRLGISFQSYTRNVEIAQNMFNMTQDQVVGLNQGLKDFADEIKMLPSVVSSNFQLVAKSLSYEGPKVAEQFKKMQMLSQQTGVSVGTLMSGFGERLDTMSGAAQFVGQLNAILGTNAFSPNEILMMDESERMLKIREVIRAHPIYDDIMGGNKLGKFALNTMSKVIGYSKEDTRKYLTGNLSQATAEAIGGKGAKATSKEGEKGSVKSQIAESLSSAINTAGQSFVKNIKAGLGDADFLKAIKANTEVMKNIYLSPTDRAMAGERGRVIGLSGQEGILSGQRDIFAQLAADPKSQRLQQLASAMRTSQDVSMTTRFGVGGLSQMIGDLDFDGQLSAGQKRDATMIAMSRIPQLTRIFEALQTLPKSPRTAKLRRLLGQLISKAGKGNVKPQEMDDAMKKAQELMSDAGKQVDAFREKDGIISYTEANLIAATRKLLGPENLGAYRTMIRLARETDDVETFRTNLEEIVMPMGGKDITDQFNESGTFLQKIDETAGEVTEIEVENMKSVGSPSRTPAIQRQRLTPPPTTKGKEDSTGSVGDQGAQINNGFLRAVNHMIAQGGLKLTMRLADGGEVKIVNAALSTG